MFKFYVDFRSPCIWYTSVQFVGKNVKKQLTLESKRRHIAQEWEHIVSTIGKADNFASFNYSEVWTTSA